MRQRAGRRQRRGGKRRMLREPGPLNDWRGTPSRGPRFGAGEHAARHPREARGVGGEHKEVKSPVQTPQIEISYKFSANENPTEFHVQQHQNGARLRPDNLERGCVEIGRAAATRKSVLLAPALRDAPIIWRDFESLEAWSRSEPHRQWRQGFLRASGGAGSWHETYFRRSGTSKPCTFGRLCYPRPPQAVTIPEEQRDAELCRSPALSAPAARIFLR
jgi:hypothetical protein